MRRTMFSSLAIVILLAGTGLAQPSYPPPDGKSVMTGVPDLSKPDWKLVSNDKTDLKTFILNQRGQNWESGTLVTINPSLRNYENSKTKMIATVVMWPEDKDGNEVLMIYGDGMTNSLAVKVGNKWSVATKMDSVKTSIIFGNDGKPAAFMISLDTVDGPKEIILELK